MTDQITSTMQVTKTTTVPLTPERAFELFTSRFATWWPLEQFHLGGAVPVTVVIEPGVGGRWFERAADGSECVWGHVLAWDPPERVVLSWQIAADWVPDSSIMTELEVVFRSVDASSTVVELEHRSLENYGQRADEMFRIFDSEQGWGMLLQRLAASAA